MSNQRNQFTAWAALAMVLAQPAPLALAAAQRTPPPARFARMPIKELTVFKDGHAFVAQEGVMPTDAAGNVTLDALPTPVIGTFWPYAADQHARLTAVVAGQRRVAVERTALSVRELIEANVGADAFITEHGTNRYAARIVGIPARSSEELAATSAPNSAERLPEKGNVVLLKTADGVKAVGIDRIDEVTFRDAPKTAGANEEFRNLLTLKLDWGGAKPAKSASVGMFYLQKGVRWIPSYKVTLDGRSNAVVQLQATFLNELADLDDVAVNLVIGVPTFTFKDTVDPMALQQTLAQLSQYFQNDTSLQNRPLAYNFSNAIMSQQPRMADFRAPEPGGGAAGGGLGPEIGDSTKSEDLFVFSVQHVTLKKGERLVLPVAEFTLSYRDVFTLELPFVPPPEVRGNFNTDQQRELARLFNAPKVMHKVRLANHSRYPLTTAPALILREGRVLAQGMMTYTAIGASTDLAITTAVDIQVKKSDVETRRTPNAVSENGNSYSRIDLAGKIILTNHRAKPTELEVTRCVLGTADTADHEGVVEKLNSFESGEYVGTGDYPSWWGWYGWPYWWNYFNGVGRLTWKLNLDPGQDAELGYTWHYIWR